jgi:proteasome assembly chaperone (PAC2) family protein
MSDVGYKLRDEASTMTDTITLTEKPTANEIFMIVGWRQWADAGSLSSLLPKYLVQELDARKIGEMKSDGFYLFQIPGTHDLVRPIVTFDNGYPDSLETKENIFYYVEVDGRGLLIFLGDEPHLDVERYTEALLDLAAELGVERIVGVSGVYAELPFDKHRPIHAIYSKRYMEEELESLALSFSDYQGGASIGSYVCRRAADRNMEYVGMYAFVPTYDFSHLSQSVSGFRVENDFKGWLDVMRRVKHMLKMNIDLADLEAKDAKLDRSIGEKIDDLDSRVPQVGIKRYMETLVRAIRGGCLRPARQCLGE